MSEQITLAQAKQWRAENDVLRKRMSAMEAAGENREGGFILFHALVLWILGGMFGLHRFFVRDNMRGGLILASAFLSALTLGLWLVVHVPFYLIDGMLLFDDKRAIR